MRSEAKKLQNLYDGAIAYLDFQIGELLDELQSNGTLQNTIVIITSDHGEEFSEHGIPSHGHTLYGSSLNVPLIIAFPPKIPKGKVVSEWVSLRDLPATITDLINLHHPHADKTFPGTSLARYWKDEEEILNDLPPIAAPILSEVRYAMHLPKWYPISKGDMVSVVVQDFHYIRSGDGKEEIYDLRKDRWETKDLSDTSGGRALSACLRNQLHAYLPHDHNRLNIQEASTTARLSIFYQGRYELPCKNLLQRDEKGLNTL